MERVAGENMYTHGILDAVSVSLHSSCCVPLAHSSEPDVPGAGHMQSYRELLASEMKTAFPAMSSAIDELGITGLHGASGGASAAAAARGQPNNASPSNDIKMEG